MAADGDGIRFGQYTLLRRIARGGMAEVFLAQQRGLEGFDRRVAVKRILPHLADAPDFIKMFLSEAKLAAQLSHPNVVHIYDFGKVEDDYFIAMEYVDGLHAGHLLRLAEAERLPPTLVARLGADAAAALHYAHELRAANGRPVGLVHRDVSPANLMVSFDGVVKLCDFGIAKAAALGDQLTNPGQVKGKYAYMSPEQTTGTPLDGRSDVFSLGIVMWELLAGKTIVGRGDAVEAMRAIRDGRLTPIERAAPETPGALAAAIGWAMQTRREHRPSARQLAELLEAFIKSSPELATSIQVGGWLRTRFARDATGEMALLSGAGASGGAESRPQRGAHPSVITSDTTAERVAQARGRTGMIIGMTVIGSGGEEVHGHDAAQGAPVQGTPARGAPRAEPAPLPHGAAQGHPSGAGGAAGPAPRGIPGPMQGPVRAVAVSAADSPIHRVMQAATVVPWKLPAQAATMIAPGRSDRSDRNDRSDRSDRSDVADAVENRGHGRPGSGSPVAPPEAPTLLDPNTLSPSTRGSPAVGVPALTVALPAAAAAGRTGRRRIRLVTALGCAVVIGALTLVIALVVREAPGLGAAGEEASGSAESAESRGAPVEGAPEEGSELAGSAQVAGAAGSDEAVDAGAPDSEVVVAAPDAGSPSDAALAAAVVTPVDAGALTILEVRTRPDGAKVRVAGRRQIAPAVFSLPPGRYAIDAEAEGWLPERRSVDLVQGVRLIQDIVFTTRLRARRVATGKLTVRTTPPCEVFLGTRRLTETPFTDMEFEPATYTLVFKHPRRATVTKQVTITAGKTTRLSFALPGT